MSRYLHCCAATLTTTKVNSWFKKITAVHRANRKSNYKGFSGHLNYLTRIIFSNMKKMLNEVRVQSLPNLKEGFMDGTDTLTTSGVFL